jgi:hypothetical protein
MINEIYPLFLSMNRLPLRKNRQPWGGAARPISAVAMSLAFFLLVSALFPAFRKKREKIETEAG